MAFIQNGAFGLAPSCLVLHGEIPSSIIRLSAIFVWVICLYHGHIFYTSKVKVRLSAIPSAIISSSAIFVYVQCLQQGHICLITTSFVYI